MHAGRQEPRPSRPHTPQDKPTNRKQPQTNKQTPLELSRVSVMVPFQHPRWKENNLFPNYWFVNSERHVGVGGELEEANVSFRKSLRCFQKPPFLKQSVGALGVDGLHPSASSGPRSQSCLALGRAPPAAGTLSDQQTVLTPFLGPPPFASDPQWTGSKW